ncbi:MAG: hypothetical protein K2I01_03120 [Lachnospiraceae bacterium]|nr:hypothetical protein [Lachnospiraceae bacterium]
MKKKIHCKLLLVPLGMYGLMLGIALFWCLAQIFHLTQQVWLNIGVATGILFMALSFIAPLTGLITGIASVVLKRKYDMVTFGSASAKGQKLADRERKAERSWRIAAVLNLVLGVVSVALCVYFVFLIRSL